MIQKLKHEHFDQIYDLLEANFIPEEYRSYEAQKELLNNPYYTIYALYTEDDEVKAFLSVWDFKDFAYFEHFAVNAKHRNGGLGGKFLNQLIEEIDKDVCLEVEIPTSQDAHRRIGFYERNNFFLNEFPYVQPSLRGGSDAVPLYIMTTSSKIVSKTFKNIKKTLYKEVYGVI